MTAVPHQFAAVLGAAGPAATTARPGTVAVCTHCGLPVPRGLVSDGRDEQFCCHGCETAYSVIHSCGLDRYYSILAKSDDDARPAKTTHRAYSEFDDPTFHALYCRAEPGTSGVTRVELLLEGVHCAACIWLVEKLPRIVPAEGGGSGGVLEARLDIRRGSVEIAFDPARVQLSSIARTLDSLGYPPHPARSPAAREARRIADRAMLVRIAVAGACAGNIMLLFFALYAGMFEGMDRSSELLFRWVAMALNTVCLAWPGAVFGRSAIAAIRARVVHLDVPIALGLYLGGLWGIWKTIAGTWSWAATSEVGERAVVSMGASDIYFDSISALILFLLVGRFLQQRQQRAAAEALELLFAVTPSVARRVDGPGSDGTGGVPTDVPTEALRIGDVVEVRAGDSIPADGVVLRGRSSVDVSLLSGESRPMSASEGARVAAGTVNIESTLRVRVETTGQATRIGKLMRMVEEASARRAAIVRLADRWGAWLLWALLALAAATLGIWWRTGPARAIDHAIALLIATCPCGLGLATPLAMTVAIGRAARRGILIKGGDALQSLSHPRARGLGGGRRGGGIVVLDKTGTITHGQLSLVRWVGDEAARPLAAALAAHSPHHVARALARDLAIGPPSTERVEHVHNSPGAGIGAEVGGRRILVGTREFLRAHAVIIDPALDGSARRLAAEGLSLAFVAMDGRCAGVAGLGDRIRPEAAAAIQSLRTRGWRVMLLSGDHAGVVAAVASRVGIDPGECRAEATPETKLAVIRDHAARGPVVMIGDGVNDAAALAAATVGISVRGGAEASLAAADISLSREGLTPVVEAFDGARRTMRTIHWTIASSLFYNVIAASLSMAGLISPLLAAFIMPASSLTVVAICLRSGAFRAGARRAPDLSRPPLRRVLASAAGVAG